MIWIITSGAGHHHSAVVRGPRNQPVSQIKGAVRARRGAGGESPEGRRPESDREWAGKRASQERLSL